MPGGERIGPLCVVDRAPRKLSAAQAALLQSLAHVACDMLVMRRDLIMRALSVRSDHEADVAASKARHRAIDARLADAQLVADKVVAAARAPFTLDALTLHIGAGLGLALGAAAGDGGRSLLDRADAQLYRAKQRGRRRVAAEAAM